MIENNMKRVLFALVLIVLPMILSSCSKNEEVSYFKEIVYTAEFSKNDGDSDLIIKGEYVDQKGKLVKVDEKLPFTIKLSEVPMGVKTGFKGYIYSVKASKLVGKITMTVKETTRGRGKEIYKNQRDVNLTTSKSTGFTNDELVKGTSFDFKEK